MTCDETRELLQVYALDAADDGEVRQVRAHLAACPACQRELASYRGSLDALALTAPPAAPSPRLRERVLLAAGIERRRRAGLLDWIRQWFAPTGGLTRLRPAVAALALVVALGSTFQAVRLQVELDRQIEANRALAAEVGARDRLVALLGPGLTTREVSGTEAAPAAEAYVYYRPDRQSAYLMAQQLPALPKGRVYQLWLIRDGKRTSGGTFGPEPDGRGRLAIEAPEPLATYQAVGVTVEPEGGSPGPTGQKVLGGAL
jgi:anti-sigma-K factor RskA